MKTDDKHVNLTPLFSLYEDIESPNFKNRLD